MSYPPTRQYCNATKRKAKIYRALNLVLMLISGLMLIAAVLIALTSDSALQIYDLPSKYQLAIALTLPGLCAGAISVNEIKSLSKLVRWCDAHLIKGCLD